MGWRFEDLTFAFFALKYLRSVVFSGCPLRLRSGEEWIIGIGIFPCASHVEHSSWRPRLLQSAIRVIGYGISAAVFMMGFVWILFDGRRRAWHDHLARTYVVYDWDARPRAALLELGEDEAIRPWV